MDTEVKQKLDSLEYKLIDIEVKLNKILELLEDDVKPNCNKMSSHIDFVDNVYDTVKSPLGFICSKVSIIGGNKKEYCLTDKLS
jgi:hypothetical protein